MNEAHEVIWIEHEATPAQLFSTNRVNMWPEIGIESITSSCPSWDQSNQPTIYKYSIVWLDVYGWKNHGWDTPYHTLVDP